MRGEILHYDGNQGFGFISGDDGDRYAFRRDDLRRLLKLAKGMRVDFRGEAGRAREVNPVPGERRVAGAAELASPIDEAPGAWGYFRRCVLANYANFRGRARRKEYWSFALFGLAGIALAAAAGVLLDMLAGTARQGEMPVIMVSLVAAFMAAMVLPSLAVTIRRQHDIGISGWFVLFSLVPTIGNLIVLAFTLIPSQKRDNRWGPVPAGVD